MSFISESKVFTFFRFGSIDISIRFFDGIFCVYSYDYSTSKVLFFCKYSTFAFAHKRYHYLILKTIY